MLKSLVKICLPLFGFGNDSCKLNMTLSTKRPMLADSQPRTNISQSCVKPSGVALLLSAAVWPTSNVYRTDIILFTM